MKTKHLLYTIIVLSPFFLTSKSRAQNREQHRSVTINQTVVDGKVISSDTIITYTDTTTRTINSKEVSIALPYTKGTGVQIDNIYRSINIRQSKDGKVKLSTTVFYYGEPSLTDEQWLKKLNVRMERISMEKVERGIYISSDGINGSVSGSSWGLDSYRLYADAQQVYSSLPVLPKPPVAVAPETRITQNGASKEVVVNGRGNTNESRYNQAYSSVGTSTAVFDEKGNNVYRSSSLRRELTIYIPEGAQLEIKSKYGNIVIDHDVADVKAVVYNASLDMLNAKRLTVSGSYGNISAGNVEDAKIELNNGKFSIKNVASLLADTRYTKVEANNIDTLKLKSVSDDYDLDAVKSVRGTKNYGNLRIDKLTGSFDLKGTSADVKIRNIQPTVSAITIDNKYADVRLPVTGLKNYEVLFSGQYSSVFAPFERKDTTMDKPVGEANAFSYTTSNGTVVSKTNPGTSPGSQSGTVQRNDDSRTIYTTTEGSVVTIGRPATAPRNRTGNFTATVGDTKGTHTRFNLTCTSCNVDFK